MSDESRAYALEEKNWIDLCLARIWRGEGGGPGMADLGSEQNALWNEALTRACIILRANYPKPSSSSPVRGGSSTPQSTREVTTDIVHQALLISDCFKIDVCNRSPCFCAERAAKYIQAALSSHNTGGGE